MKLDSKKCTDGETGMDGIQDFGWLGQEKWTKALANSSSLLNPVFCTDNIVYNIYVFDLQITLGDAPLLEW